jgi:hypothetical protein
LDIKIYGKRGMKDSNIHYLSAVCSINNLLLSFSSSKLLLLTGKIRFLLTANRRLLLSDYGSTLVVI